MRMKRQLGFGLIEVLVAVTLLSIVTIAMLQFFSLTETSKSNITISLKNLQQQRYLERAIWANYDAHNNANANCNITTVSTISLDINNNCANNAGGTARAEKKELMRSSCSYESFSSNTLSLSGCGASLETLANNINTLPSKSEFKVLLWASNVNAATCRLANISSPATVAGASIQLQLNSECVIDMASATSPTVRVPQIALIMKSKNGQYDGYQRLYY
jgi:prepilin-type N-terminal cleavage/methylation domain-containing protein